MKSLLANEKEREEPNSPPEPTTSSSNFNVNSHSQQIPSSIMNQKEIENDEKCKLKSIKL